MAQTVDLTDIVYDINRQLVPAYREELREYVINKALKEALLITDGVMPDVVIPQSLTDFEIATTLSHLYYESSETTQRGHWLAGSGSFGEIRQTSKYGQFIQEAHAPCFTDYQDQVVLVREETTMGNRPQQVKWTLYVYTPFLPGNA